MIDKARLLAWLKERTTAKSPVVGAVYAGLITRIQRGDFDERKEGHHGTHSDD